MADPPQPPPPPQVEREPEEAAPMSKTRKRLLLVYFIVFATILIFLLLLIWPVQMTDGKSCADSCSRFGITITLEPELRTLLLVVVAAALGTYVHAATSFATFVGNRTSATSWTTWYILRPFIGIALALVVYFNIRGGFVLEDGGGGKLNPFAMSAVAAMSGMFSKEATGKLAEVFNTLFAPKAGSQIERAHKDKSTDPPVGS